MTTTVASAVVTAASSGFDEAIGNDAQLLRDRVLEHLRQQGFRFANNRLLAPVSAAKGEIRALHEEAVAAQRARAGPGRRWRATKNCFSTNSPGAALSMSLPFPPPSFRSVITEASRGCCGGGWRRTGPSRYRWGMAAGCGFWSWIVRTVTN